MARSIACKKMSMQLNEFGISADCLRNIYGLPNYKGHCYAIAGLMPLAIDKDLCVKSSRLHSITGDLLSFENICDKIS